MYHTSSFQRMLYQYVLTTVTIFRYPTKRSGHPGYNTTCFHLPRYALGTTRTLMIEYNRTCTESPEAVPIGDGKY